jgi:hypothetical protein
MKQIAIRCQITTNDRNVWEDTTNSGKLVATDWGARLRVYARAFHSVG